MRRWGILTEVWVIVCTCEVLFASMGVLAVVLSQLILQNILIQDSVGPLLWLLEHCIKFFHDIDAIV